MSGKKKYICIQMKKEVCIDATETSVNIIV